MNGKFCVNEGNPQSASQPAPFCEREPWGCGLPRLIAPRDPNAHSQRDKRNLQRRLLTGIVAAWMAAELEESRSIAAAAAFHNKDKHGRSPHPLAPFRKRELSAKQTEGFFR